MAGKNFCVRTGLLIAVFLPGQTYAPVAGTVTTKDGQPISGVTVTAGRPCCPSQQTTTNQLGHFRLDHAGPVIYFSKDKFEPKAVVVRSKQGAIHIILEPPSDNLVVPVCRETDAGQQRIGWGKYGLQFNVMKHDVEILGGKPDVDYVRYVVKAKTGGKGYLELWFGPTQLMHCRKTICSSNQTHSRRGTLYFLTASGLEWIHEAKSMMAETGVKPRSREKVAPFTATCPRKSPATLTKS